VTSATTPRLVVLGAEGFIGHTVVHQALAHGLSVTALAVGDPWRLSHVSDLSVVNVGARWSEARFATELRRLLDEASVLALLAYRPPPRDASEAKRAAHERNVNVAGVEIACEAAAGAGARVVFASTADVYGRRRDELLSEDADAHPETPYATAKLAAEHVVAKAQPSSVSLRIATVYGPGETAHRAIPRFLTALILGKPIVLHGDGSDVRDYVHVSDVAATAIAAALAPSPSRVVNVGSGVGRTTAEILTATAAAVGVAPVVQHERPRPPSRLVLDVGLARRTLGLSPRMDLVRELRAEAAWLREHLRQTAAGRASVASKI
jgi:UDP-glucose 4-epimerase